MKFEATRTGSPISRAGATATRCRSISAVSSRARWAPRQKCGPTPPNATCGFGSRCRSRRWGSGTPPGRGWRRRTRSPPCRRRATCWSPSTVSRVAVRRKCCTGDTKRSSSSTALARCSGCSPSQRHWSCSCSATTAPETALRVVSFPAITSSSQNIWNSASVRCSPSTSACTIRLTTSSRGSVRRASAIACPYAIISASAVIESAACSAADGLSAPSSALLHSKMR